MSTLLGLGGSQALAATQPSHPVVASVGQDMLVTLVHAGGADALGLRRDAVLKVEVTSEAVQNLVGGASLRVEVDVDCAGQRIRTRRFEVFHGARQTGAQTVRPTTGAWTLATPGSYVPDIVAAVCSQPAVEIASAADTPTAVDLAALSLKPAPAPQLLALPSADIADQVLAGGDSLDNPLGLAASAEPVAEAPTEYGLLKAPISAVDAPPMADVAAKVPDLSPVQTFEMAVEPSPSPADETGPTEYRLRASRPVRLDAPPFAELDPMAFAGAAVPPVDDGFDLALTAASPPSPPDAQPVAPDATLAAAQSSPPLTTLAPQAVSVKVETGEASPFGDATPPSLEDQANPRMTAVLTPISMTSPPAMSANASLNRIVSASEALQSGGAATEAVRRYWVQILSTNNAAGARASLERAIVSLKASVPRGSGEVQLHRIGSETLYRVRLQGFASRTEASDFCASYLGSAKACLISEH